MAVHDFRQAKGGWLVAWWLLLALAYIALGTLSRVFVYPVTAVESLWLPAGWALAALLYRGWRLWPGVALGAFMTALLLNQGVRHGALLALAAPAEALLGAWLIHRLVARPAVLQHLGDVRRFILVVLVAPLPAVLLRGAAVAVHGGWGVGVTVIPRHWLGDCAGMLIFAPLALGWTVHAYASPTPRHGELALFMIGEAATAEVVFGGWLPSGSLVFLLIGFFLWAAMRLGLRGTVVSNLIVAVIAAYHTAQGTGPFVVPSPLGTQWTLQAFLVTAAAAGLLLVAAMHERGEALEELRLSDRIIDAAPEHIAVVTPQHIYRRVNQAYQRAYGWTTETIVGRSVADLMGEGVYARVARPNLERGFVGDRFRYGAWFEFPALGRRYMLVTYLPLLDAEGKVSELAVLSRDITDIKRAEEKLQLAASVIENTPVGVMITDARQRIISVNPAFIHNSGYSYGETVGRKASILSSGRHDRAFFQRMWEAINERGSWQGEIWNRRKNGDIHVEWLSIVAIRDADGAVSHYAGLFSDITSQEHVRNRLHNLAYHDPLTELPNRELFNNRLQNILVQARREQRLVGVMFIDLDRFKLINDTLGHSFGDELLKAVAGLLRSCVRESDTVARLGGDEFTILMTGLTHADDIDLVAGKIIEMLALPVNVGDRELHITASIGTALYPEDGSDVETLLHNADTAMYTVKQAGRHGFRRYRPSMG